MAIHGCRTSVDMDGGFSSVMSPALARPSGHLAVAGDQEPCFASPGRRKPGSFAASRHPARLGEAQRPNGWRVLARIRTRWASLRPIGGDT
jgi:hypothetical protein